MKAVIRERETNLNVLPVLRAGDEDLQSSKPIMQERKRAKIRVRADCNFGGRMSGRGVLDHPSFAAAVFRQRMPLLQRIGR